MDRNRTMLRGVKTDSRSDKVLEKEKKVEMEVNRSTNIAKSINRSQSRRERKLALQQDVDKLRKKLRHEENVHRALERAFTRPLGALPRLPPYLPSHTLELLAEVAVLEEEVVRLEEQVVNFRQGLYQEAIIISSKKNNETAHVPDGERCPSSNAKNCPQLKPSTQVSNSDASASMRLNSDQDPNWPSSNRVAGVKQTPTKQNTVHDDRPGKENQLSTASAARNVRRSPVKKVPKRRIPAMAAKRSDAQPVSVVNDRRKASEIIRNTSEQALPDDSSGPNKLSEEILKCLLSIFVQMTSSNGRDEERASSPSVSGSSESSEDADSRDPYSILEFGKRDVGAYKKFRAVHATSFDPNLLASNTLLARRLKALLRKLTSVDLAGLSHQQKLAFWINIYNSCMMNAFLEQGIPTTPHMLVALMPKASINVSGRVLTAMTIEHFILRLPYSVKHVNPKGMKSDDMTMRGVFGLEWPEPLVTFALSCGSWSSPAVRMYTASRVEEELEAAKRDFLQAAVGISSKLAIPKLLHWYLLDFAKDVDSLMDWICLQLPSEMQNTAVKLLEDGRRSTAPRPIQVLPYDFRFRCLLAS